MKQENLEEVISNYSGYIYKIITNISKGNLSNEDIEEVISDVFLVFWKNKDKFDNTKQLNPYLAGITKNLLKEKFRKIHINSNIEEYENLLVDNLDIEYYYEQRETNRIIENCLNNMPKEDKEIFILFYYNSKKIKEIAKELQYSEFKVKSKLFRIRKKVKKELEKGGYRNE